MFLSLINQDGWSTGSAQSVQRWCLAQPCAWCWRLGHQSCPPHNSLPFLLHRTYRWFLPVLKLLLTFVYSVADVSQDSGVGGEAGLRAGDVLLAIQGRKIANMSAYRSCSSFFCFCRRCPDPAFFAWYYTRISEMITHPLNAVVQIYFREVLATLIREGGGGLCVDHNRLTKPLRSFEGKSCCEGESSGSLCFTRSQSDEYHCLAVRPLLKTERLHCWDGDECERGNVCLLPLLEGNSSRLLIADRQQKQQLIFLGSPAELYQSVQITEYCPRVAQFPIRLPDQTAKLLRYTFSISFGLALLNIVPCYLLDGHHIASAILSLLPVPQTTKHMATFTLTSLGSALVALNLAIGLVAVVREGRLPL